MSIRISFSIASAVVAGMMCCGWIEAADWPQLQGNPAHTGYTADEPKPAYRLCWLRDLEEPTQSAAQPIVAGDKLYVGTGHGNLHALGRADGKTLWTYHTAAPIFGTPAWAEGIVYVDSLDHCCHAVRDADGSRLWTFETAAPLWAAPVVADGKVFIGGRDGFVYALDARSGAELWRSSVPSVVMCTPAWSEGTLYVGVGDMRIYALEGATGRRLW
jgi:outer membrane protein assembly factor BamB